MPLCFQETRHPQSSAGPCGVGTDRAGPGPGSGRHSSACTREARLGGLRCCGYICENLPFIWFVHLQHRPGPGTLGSFTYSSILVASCVQEPVPGMRNSPQGPCGDWEQGVALPQSCKGKGHLQVTKGAQDAHCLPAWTGFRSLSSALKETQLGPWGRRQAHLPRPPLSPWATSSPCPVFLSCSW